MVSLLGLFEPLLVLGHLLGVRETDTIHSLEGIRLGVSQKVGGRSFGDGESFDLAGVGDMRSEAEIDERTFGKQTLSIADKKGGKCKQKTYRICRRWRRFRQGPESG